MVCSLRVFVALQYSSQAYSSPKPFSLSEASELGWRLRNGQQASFMGGKADPPADQCVPLLEL